MESLQATTAVEVCLNSWGKSPLKPNFVVITIGDFVFAPICSKKRINFLGKSLPKDALDSMSQFCGTKIVWEKFVDAFGAQEARSGYATREAISENKVTHIADRDLLRLVGGYSESWEREFEGGNPFTGYAMYKLSDDSIIGRMAAGTGYKPSEDLVAQEIDGVLSYKAEPWTREEMLEVPITDDRGAAELQIGDGVDTRLPRKEFIAAYKACILASIVIAHQFWDKVKQDGVYPRRLTITIINPEKCKLYKQLEVAEIDLLASKRKVLEGFGFKERGSLFASDVGAPIDLRNYDNHVRDVMVLTKHEVAVAFERHIKSYFSEHVVD